MKKIALLYRGPHLTGHKRSEFCTKFAYFLKILSCHQVSYSLIVALLKCHHIVHILQITSICKSWAHSNNVHPLNIQTADFLQPGCSSHRLTVLSQHISKLPLNCRHQSSSLSEILLCSIRLSVSVQPDGKCLKSNLCTLTDHSPQSIYSSLFPFQAISSLISTAFMQLLVSSESADLKV